MNRLTVLVLFALTSACGLIRVNGQPLGLQPAASPSDPPSDSSATGPAPSTPVRTDAPKPEPTPGDQARARFEDQARRALEGQPAYVDFLQGDLDLTNFREQVQRETGPVDDALAASLIERHRTRVQEVLSGGAEKHQGWANTTPAPEAAAKVAIERVRAHPYLRGRDRFTFLSVRVLDPAWIIERSRIGLPLAQFKRVSVVARREGLEGCVAFSATINHANQGGSTYSKDWGSVAPLSDWVGVKCPDTK